MPRILRVPPSLREIAGQGGNRWSLYPIPARNPLLPGVEHRNCVKARHQDPVQRPHPRDEGVVFARTFWHSIILTLILGVLVALQQYVFPGMIPH